MRLRFVETYQRSYFINSVAICLLAMLLVGCRSSASPDPTRTVETVTSAPAQATLAPTSSPATARSFSQQAKNPSATPSQTAAAIPANKISLPYDLLFLANGNLMRWSHRQGSTRPAIIDVVDYSANQDESKIAVLRKTGMTANAIEIFNLTVLDTRSGEFVSILDSTPRLVAFQISPDGQWLALMDELYQLYLLPADGSGSIKKITVCQHESPGDCDDIAWSPDSLSVIWDDSKGIWQASPNELVPIPVIANKIDIADPKGQQVRKQVQFHGLNWSPFGRYIQTRIQPVGSNVSWQAVVDTFLGRMAEISTSYELDQPSAQTLWLDNGDLLVVSRDPEQTNQPVALDSWQILPTRPDLMSLDFRWEFGYDQLVESGKNDRSYRLPTTPCQLNDRTISLAWNSSPMEGPAKLFTFDIKYGILNKVAELPIHIVKTFWTPEGDASLVKGLDGTLMYVSVDGRTISDLTDLFGRQSCCFTWLSDETALP